MNVQSLYQSPLFASLPHHEIRSFARSLRQLNVAPGTLLIHEGDPGDRFFFILAGELEIVKALGTPDERLIRVDGPGTFVGEMGLLNRNALRSASARARSDVSVLEVTYEKFEALLRHHPTVAFDLARTLSARLREADNATIRDLHAKNEQLTAAYRELQAAQTQIIEKQALERELELARRIQASMLPHSLPEPPGFNFSACMVPATAVGGDFYDVFALDHERIGIAIGDVSGKSVSAALFMAMTRSLLRGAATRTAAPSEVLLNVNRQLLEMNGEGMFVTVLYGVLNCMAATFDYARAGQDLPLLVYPNGTSSLLPLSCGHPLGILADPALDEQTIVLPAGLLLLYTDGVTEASNSDGALFGLERLQAVVRASRLGTARDLCDCIMQSLVEYRGDAAQTDDITLVVVQRTTLRPRTT